jgi:hypothetical protein
MPNPHDATPRPHFSQPFRKPPPITSLARFLALATLLLVPAPAPQSLSAQRAILPTQTPAASAPAAALPSSQPITLTIRLALPPDRAAALQQRLADQLDPSSPEYHRWLTPQQFAATFGPTDDQLAATTAWLQSQSLSVTAISTAHTTLTATGTAAQVESAFAVSLKPLPLHGPAVFANANQPSLPREVSTLIAGISGLDNIPSTTTIAALAASLDTNSAPILTLTTICEDPLAQADIDAYTALFQQANVQGVTILTTSNCAANSTSLPASLAEATVVSLPRTPAPADPILATPRPVWQSAPGLPEDQSRHAPDLTTTSLTALTQTISTIATQSGGRLGNINATLYGLAPTPGLYTQPDQAPAGTWEPATGLGLINLDKLLKVYPRGTGTSYLSLAASNYAPVHGSSVTLTATLTSGTGGVLPTGTVTFSTASSTLGSATITSGTATLALATLPGGSQTITAAYSGDTTYAASTATSTLFVQAEPSVLSATVSSANVVGGTYTLSVTDTAASGVGRPSGTVTVTLSGTTTSYTGALAASTTNASAATITIPASIVGISTLSIECSGDASYSCNNPYTTTVTVTKATPTLTISYTPNPPVSGAAISFTASLAAVGTAAVPTGNVSFFDNATTINAGKLVNGAVTVTGIDITAPSHTISATYDGDANYQSVTVTGSTAGTTATMTTVAPTSATATFGATTILTATVSPAATGTVNFLYGTTLLCAATLTSGTATCATATLPVGTDTVTASYLGNSTYAPSSATTTVTISPASTALVTGTLSATLAPISAPYNTTGVVTAVVTLPTGTTLPTNAAVNATIAGSTQTFSATLIPSTPTTATALIALPTPPPGTYAVAVTCTATLTFVCSDTVPLALTATLGATSTTVTATPSQAVAGSALSLYAAVLPSPASTTLTVAPTGTVTFYDNALALGTVNLSSGATASLPITVGSGATHIYTAAYIGDTNYLPSTSTGTTIGIVPVAPTVTLASSSASSLFGLNVTLTALVNGVTNSLGVIPTPTGTINFFEISGGSPLLIGSGILAPNSAGAAIATLSTTGFFDGTHTLYAVYTGDTRYLTSTTNAISISILDYNIAFSPQNLTVSQGATVQSTLAITPVGAFAGTVTLACNPPAGAQTTCTLSPETLTTPGSAILTITTSAPTAATLPWRLAAGPTLALLLLFTLPGRTRRTRLAIAPILLLTVSLGCTLGCGGVSGTVSPPSTSTGSPLGTSLFTVTASGSSGTSTTRHTYSVQVTIVQ